MVTSGKEAGTQPGERPLDRTGMFAVFVVSLGTLMMEILLTRVFSVTMWYHFAFVAVSLAMLGLSAGAVLVYLMPNAFSAARARPAMAWLSLVLAVTVTASVWVHVSLRFGAEDMATFRSVTLVLMLIPFTASGVVICLALTRFPPQVGRIYAFDLAGAALGCVGVIVLLEAIGDVFTSIVLVSALLAFGSSLFARGVASGSLRSAAWLTTLGLLVLGVVSGVRFHQGSPLLEVAWAKGSAEDTPLLERWNSYSRIKVTGDTASPMLSLVIDAAAATALWRFDGDPEAVEDRDRITGDLPAVVHQLRPGASVAIIGTGGGQDILAAHMLGQPRITGIEMNDAIVDALVADFGDYTGNLTRIPGIELVNDEARSFLSRSGDSYDVIMATLIDTWAATAAGAFVLSENSLYTVEAWETFLGRLKPGGVLSFTRWYRGEYPGEMYRMVSIAVEALRRRGVTEPERHIVVLKKGIHGNIFVSNEPFSNADLRLLTKLGRKRFQVRFTSQRSADPIFSALASGDGEAAALAALALDVSPSTDDRPFFFNMMPLRITGGDTVETKYPADQVNREAVAVLVNLTLVIGGLVVAVVLVPLALTARRVRFTGSAPYMLFFASIGAAFMLVEVSQLQRLAIFLGHPTYSLSVVLFSLLVASAAGSFTTSRIADDAIDRRAPLLMLALLATLAALGLCMPMLLQLFRGAEMAQRIAAGASMILPMGFVMGMAFPVGIRLADRAHPEMTPWFWGINGATSVLASVLAVAIALAAGISATYWVGVGGYVLAAACIALMSRPRVT